MRLIVILGVVFGSFLPIMEVSDSGGTREETILVGKDYWECKEAPSSPDCRPPSAMAGQPELTRKAN